MLRVAVITVILALGVSACAGVDIKPITQQQAIEAHEAGSTVRGYLVYAPVVVVEVSAKELCVGKDAKGKCIQDVRCVAGAPFVLPDYSKPYLINAKSGLGKSGVDMTIADGWRLGALKDSSDNGVMLGLIERMIARGPGEATDAAHGGGCDGAGLYRVTVEQGGMTLSRLLAY